MAGRGPIPKQDGQRRRGAPPVHGWKQADGVGWQHGSMPPAPYGLTKPAKQAWEVWFASWFAAFWTPEDVPGLRQLVRLYDQVERGEFQRHSELRLAMDTYGITPKGQQDRRWQPPSVDAQPVVDHGMDDEELAEIRALHSVG